MRKKQARRTERRLGLGIEPLESRAMLTTLPAGFTETIIADDLRNSTRIAFAPDGRLFFLEKSGTIRIAKNDQFLPTPFGTVPTQSYMERGLKGIAFDPNFESNQHFYLYYTTPGPEDATVRNRVSRFTADGDTMVPGSEVVLIDLPDLTSTMHNGGSLNFGNDGKLYITVGDNFNSATAQRMDSLFGKILRINSDGSIPTDNPFYNSTSGQFRAIYAIGVRNPFESAVHPGNGRIFVNDVGASSWEEINWLRPGKNYGWPQAEGNSTNPAFTNPEFTYGHDAASGLTPNGCSITGGSFYTPEISTFPSDYANDYFFGDFCGSWINRFDPVTKEVDAFAVDTVANIVDVEVGPDGSLYYLTLGTGGSLGSLAKIQYTQGQTAPQISYDPNNLTVAVGERARFTVTANGTAPLLYQWQRNGVNIPGETARTLVLDTTTMADDGDRFRVIVRNAVGVATSAAATLTVIDSARPVARIEIPSGATYRAGTTLSFSGVARDAEDGTLPASAYQWSVGFHHATHVHPAIDSLNGVKSGSLEVPTRAETASNVWFRIHLTVTDSAGLTRHVFKDVHPEVRTHQLSSSPAGLPLTLDGQPVTGTISFDSVVGVVRALGTNRIHYAFGKQWEFVGWSDGGSIRHEISSPEVATNYVATFREVPNAKPQLANYGGNVQFVRGSYPVRITSTITVSDADGPSLAGGQLIARVSENAATGDELTLRAGPHVTLDGADVLFDGQMIGRISGQGSRAITINLNAQATTGHAQAILRSIFFHNKLSNPGTAVRSVLMNVRDRLVFADAVLKSVSIAPNAAPAVEISTTPVPYDLNAAAVLVAPEATLSDTDSPNFAGGILRVRVIAGIHASNQIGIQGGQFTFNGDQIIHEGKVIGVRNADGGEGFTFLQIKLSANATTPVVQKLLRSITFRTTASSFAGDRVLEFALSDGDGSAATVVNKRVDVN